MKGSAYMTLQFFCFMRALEQMWINMSVVTDLRALRAFVFIAASIL
jgi:hypothetical protein